MAEGPVESKDRCAISPAHPMRRASAGYSRARKIAGTAERIPRGPLTTDARTRLPHFARSFVTSSALAHPKMIPMSRREVAVPLPVPVSETETEPDDVQVVEAVLRGAREQFEMLVRRYNQRLFRVGMAYLRRPDRVEDAMQNAYVHAFVHLAQFSGRAAFSTWLTRIMINECLMQLRHSRLVDAASSATEIDPTTPRVDHHPAARNLDAADAKVLLEQCIAELPEALRTVYMLREIQQLDTEETAVLLDLSPENVKVRLHRAREMLKGRLLATVAGHELFTYGAARCQRLTASVMSAIACLMS
jgi:RNA polymerase sigma-70 factor (ECF subfamily)